MEKVFKVKELKKMKLPLNKIYTNIFINKKEKLKNNIDKSKINKNKINYNHKNGINILLIIYFIIIFLPISISQGPGFDEMGNNENWGNNEEYSSDSNNIVSLVIKGRTDRILPYDFQTPEKVLINGMIQELSTQNENENTIKIIWKTPLTSCKNMFTKLTKIISIDFSNLDTSNVEDMSSMFQGCIELTSLNLSNFDTSNVKRMENMFYGCNNLKSLDLSNFNTKSVINMNSMFFSCSSLTSVNLENFNTKSLETMENMFYNDESLTYLDLSSFNTIAVANMNGMFYNCKSLLCVNLKSFIEKEDVMIDNIFSDDISELDYCIDREKAKKIYSFLTSKNLKNNCENFCSLKFISESIDINVSDTEIYQKVSQSIENITITRNTDIFDNSDNSEIIVKTNITDNINNNDKIKNYDFTNNIEYSENSNNIQNSDEADKFDIIDIIKKTNNFENTNNVKFSENIKYTNILEYTNEFTKIMKNFSSENFFLDSYDMSNINLTIKDEIIKNIKEDIIKGNLKSLIGNITGEKKDLIVIQKDTIYQITTSDNQKNNKYNNISTINLGKCEDKLKEVYNIDSNLSLIIFKVDYYKEGSLIPVISYEVYNPKNNSQLNLSYCKDILIDLEIPVSIDEDNLFKYNPNSDYYTDECYSYTTENGTDIILNDRHIEYNDNNLSICENNCSLTGYDSNTKKALCECESKTQISSISEINEDENIFFKDFNGDNTTSNLVSMKCVNILFSKDGLIANLGNYILIFTIILFLICAIIFYKCGYHIIQNNIKEILSSRIKSEEKADIFNASQKNKKIFKKTKKKKKMKANPTKKYKRKIIQDKEKEQNNLGSSKTGLASNNEKSIKIIEFKEEMNVKKIDYNIMKKYKDCELNSFNYKEAQNFDKRIFKQYYFSLLKSKQLILFSFYPIEDYNIKLIKICLFFLFFDIYFAVNTFFFNDSTIHQIYKDEGVYNLSYFLPKIIYSFLISYFINILIKYFSLSERNILEIKKEKKNSKLNDKAEKVKRCLIIKYILFFTLSFIFLIFFWYYLSAFCAVYKNSQYYVMNNTLISFSICLIFPFIFNLLPTILRIYSLKKQNSEFIFILSKCMQLI